jgi:hypothetical protein
LLNLARLKKRRCTMADVLNHTFVAAAREPERSHDVKILLSVGLLAVAFIVAVLVSILSTGVDAGDFASMYPPYP